MGYQMIAVLDNLIEAAIFEEILKDNAIPYIIRSYDDLAYGNIYQLSKGWGEVEAPEEYGDKIRQLLTELRNSEIAEK